MTLISHISVVRSKTRYERINYSLLIYSHSLYDIINNEN